MGGDDGVAVAGIDQHIVRVGAMIATPDWTRPGRQSIGPRPALIDQGEPDAYAQWFFDQLDPLTHWQRYRRALQVRFLCGAEDTHVPPEAAHRFVELVNSGQDDPVIMSSTRCANRNTRRAYTTVLDRVLADLDGQRALVEVTGDELGGVLDTAWGQAGPATWNRNRAALSSWLSWCARNRYPAPVLPPGVERRVEHADETRALPRAAIERQLSRRDVPLREKTLWRMLYETAARASEVLALDIEDLDLSGRRAKLVSKGEKTEWVFWSSGTAHLLPRLIRGRTSGPVFVSHRQPGPAWRPAAQDLCPDTGKARLGYDRSRILLRHYTGWDLHQLRHSAATHLGEKNVELQTIMAKTRHRNPRSAMRYIKPGAEAVAEATDLLGLGRGHR